MNTFVYEGGVGPTWKKSATNWEHWKLHYAILRVSSSVQGAKVQIFRYRLHNHHLDTGFAGVNLNIKKGDISKWINWYNRIDIGNTTKPNALQED